MKKIVLLVALCALTIAGTAQRPHAGRPPQHQPMTERHHPARHHEPHREFKQPCATPEQLEAVLKALEAQSFDDKKMEVAKLCVFIGNFCTDDLARIARVFSFDESRLTFLIYAHPYCSDRERYPLLKEVFAFSSNYDKLLEATQPR